MEKQNEKKLSQDGKKRKNGRTNKVVYFRDGKIL